MKAHLLVIRQWTRDICHIEAKNNMMADFLSRAHTIRKNYVTKSADPDLEAAIHEINIDELEMVSLQTLSPQGTRRRPGLVQSNAMPQERKQT